MGAHGCSCLWAVVGCCGHGCLWAVCGSCACLCSWAVGGHCGWSCCDGGRCGWLHRDHHGRGHSLPFMFMGGHLLLLEVIIVGGCCCLLSLCVGGGREWSWLCVICVDGGGKKEGSHVTHRDNGITFKPPHEFTCK